MTTLSSQDTFSVTAGSTQQQQVTLLTVSGPVAPDGLGRLTHPTLGTYDYSIAPAEFGNMDTDAIIPPILSHTRTLSGAANTKWNGYMRDVEVYERWLGKVALKAPQFRMMLDMWTNTPEPPEYIVWTPNYLNNNAYKVIISDLSCGGGKGINLDYTLFQGDGFIKGPVELKMRLIEYN